MCVLSVGRDCLTCPRFLGRNSSLMWQVRDLSCKEQSPLSSLWEYINCCSTGPSIIGKDGEMGLGLNAHIGCLQPPEGAYEEAAAPAAAAFGCSHHGGRCWKPGLCWNSNALALMPLLYQGLDFTVPTEHCLPLPSQECQQTKLLPLLPSNSSATPGAWLEEPSSPVSMTRGKME